MGKFKYVPEERKNEGVTWWRATYSNDALEPYQVIKEKAHFVTYLRPRLGANKTGFIEHREAKDSRHCPWFPSFDAGKSYLIGKKMDEIEHFERRLSKAKEDLKNLQSMQKPEVTL